MKYKHTSAFTLIELIVSITIFAIIMVSVISIFIFASQLGSKIEINRVMQENIKNVVETIAEDVRENGISGVSEYSVALDCSTLLSDRDTGDKLCTDVSEYYLAVKNGPNWIRTETASCTDLDSRCTLVREYNGSLFPLTNSFVAFRDLEFKITRDEIPKVTILFHLQPATRKGVRASAVEGSEIYFQTTISERLIDIR